MRRMAIAAIYPKKDTSIPHPGHKKYPNLLRGVQVNRVNPVWSTDITYIRLNSGLFIYAQSLIGIAVLLTMYLLKEFGEQ